MQLVSAQLQIENTIRGLLRLYGFKIGAIHRNRFAVRVAELLEMAGMSELSAAIEPLLRVREGMRTERKLQDRVLATLSRRDQVTRRLMTFPASDRLPPWRSRPRSTTSTGLTRRRPWARTSD